MTNTLDTATPQRPRLHPMGVADLLDMAVNLYRQNFLKLILIAAIIIVPLSALDAVTRVMIYVPMFSPENLESDSSALMLAGQGLNILLSLFSSAIIYGIMLPAMVWAVGQYYMGHPATLLAAYGKALRRLPVTAAIGFLYGIIMTGLLLVWIIPCLGWLGGLAAWMFVSVNVLTLLAPVVMLEKNGVVDSLKRCWVLAKSNFWRAFGLLVALYLFSTAVTSGPSTLAMFLFLLMADNVALGTAVNAAIGALLSVVYMPVWGIGLTLLYYDTRVRREAFDLEVLAGIETQPVVQRQVKWFERSDWKTLAILVALMFVPIVLFGLFYTFLVVLVALAGMG